MSSEKLNRLIDRLVDHELPDDELKSLLRECKNNPSRWQTMALAFIESQVISKELLALRQEGDSKPTLNRRFWQVPNRLSEWFTVATVAALAIGFGFGFGKISLPGTDRAGNGFDNRVVDFNSQSPEPSDESLGGDSFHILVSNPDGSLREVEVPLVDNMRDFRDRSGYPSDLVDQIRRQGHQVDYQRRFVPVILRDGRDAIVPIDSMRFRSKRYQ
ncbi:hypothetical protein ACFL2H_04705 [Planctomycetota bacterium]